MVLSAIHRVSFVIALAFGLLFALSTDGFTHSGGTDKYGCHAGSKPYHCHGGGGGGPNKTVNKSGPSAAQRAKQANISRAKAEVSQAKSKHESSKKTVKEVEQKLDTHKEMLEKQRTAIAGVQGEIDRNRDNADSLRSSWIADREDAAERILLVKSENRDARKLHEVSVLSSAFFGAFLGAFLLYRVARWLAGLIVGFALRFALIASGSFAAFLLLTSIPAVGSLGAGIVLAVLAGLLLALLLMLVRMWLIAATMPPKFAFSLLGVVAIVAVAFLVGAFAAPPVGQSPALEDLAMVQEVQADPTAEGLAEANEADANADQLQSEVDALSGELESIEAKVADLSERAKEAKEKASADKEAVVSAKDALSLVQ